MKHDELRSIAHNIADSLASGCGLMIGIYEIDVFGSAAQSVQGLVDVNFLDGTVRGSHVSHRLAEAVRLYKEALPGLCERHHGSVNSFEQLIARYFSDSVGGRFQVTVKDINGRSSVTAYGGIPGQRVKLLDPLGRLRPKNVVRAHQSPTTRF